MYPRGELDALAARKALLQARIAVRRWEVAQAASRLARPLAMVDRGLQMWRSISPFVKLLALPGGLLLTKFLKSRRPAASTKKGLLATALGAMPLIFRGVKLVHEMRAAKASRRRDADFTRGPVAAGVAAKRG